MKSKFWIVVLLVLGAVVNGLAAEKSSAVVVLDFSISNNDSNRLAWAQGGLADLLQTELGRQGMKLLDRDMVHAVLNEQRLAAGGVTADGFLALGKLLNAQYLISGKITQLADGSVKIAAETFSVEAVETKIIAEAEGALPIDLHPMVQKLAMQISVQLPHGIKTGDETKQASRNPNPESLIMFYRGLNACVAEQPEKGVAYFMNAASLDPSFTVPLLWEIKAYEMAGLTAHAAIRRKELADILKPIGLQSETTNVVNRLNQPTVAILNPIVNVGGGVDSVSLSGDLKRALLAENQVRVFAYEGIGAAVAEHDLRLSDFFSDQNAPRYGRWLTADGLLICRVTPAEHDLVSVELSIVNPMNTAVMGRILRTMSATKMSAKIPKAIKELVKTG